MNPPRIPSRAMAVPEARPGMTPIKAAPGECGGAAVEESPLICTSCRYARWHGGHQLLECYFTGREAFEGCRAYEREPGSDG